MTNDEDAICRFSMKFGADMTSALKLIERASALNLDLVGVSFHVGSGQMSPKAFGEAIENARKLFDYARDNYAIRMHLLDLGGGYPGSSEADQVELFSGIAREINSALDKWFPLEFFAHINGNDENKLKIIAEPGRYYACSAFTLCVSVIAKRVMSQTDTQQSQDEEALKKSENQMTLSDREDEPTFYLRKENSFVDHSKSIMYYVNDGVYASFNCLFYDHAECFPCLIKENRSTSSTTLYKSSLWGPTCDGLDVISKECHLPELEIGEAMVFKNMGAYTLSGAVAFNGIPLARCIYTCSTSWETIKNAFDEQQPVEYSCESFMMNDTCGVAASLSFMAESSDNQKKSCFEYNTDASSDEEASQTSGISIAMKDCAIKC
jgi:ornithine decarboxylase